MFLAENFYFDKSTSIAFDRSNAKWAKTKPIYKQKEQIYKVYAIYYDNTPNNWQSTWAGIDRKFGMWQYTESKNIAPISGNVDCNVAYKNYPLIIKSLHLNNF